MLQRGGDSWFFLTANYAFGLAFERDAADLLKRNGGKVTHDPGERSSPSDIASVTATTNSAPFACAFSLNASRSSMHPKKFGDCTTMAAVSSSIESTRV